MAKPNSRGYIGERKVRPSRPVCREVEQNGSCLAQLTPPWCAGSVAATWVSPCRSLQCPSRLVIPGVLPDPRWLHVVAKPLLTSPSAPGKSTQMFFYITATNLQVSNLGAALPKSTETEFGPLQS